MKTIYRYTVPVDDQWHTLKLDGAIHHVAARQPDTIEIWALHTGGEFAFDRHLRVFGTGQPMDDECRYVGTALATGGLVWHLMERW